MASVGLNKWVVSGNLAADAEVKTIEARSGKTLQVAEATIYVRGIKNRDESFTIALNIWEDSAAWRKLSYLKKGSLIICTGSAEPSPYLSKQDNAPKAGLRMTVLDIDLDVVRNNDDSVSAAKIVAEKSAAEKVSAAST